MGYALLMRSLSFNRTPDSFRRRDVYKPYIVKKDYCTYVHRDYQVEGSTRSMLVTDGKESNLLSELKGGIV